MSKRIKKYSFTFGNGIAKCGYCDCSMSCYITKGHVYIQYSKAKMSCSNNCAERVLIDQISSEVFDSIKIKEPIISKVVEEIKNKKETISISTDNIHSNLMSRYTILQNRSKALYIDKLDGRITINEYNKLAEEIRLEMDEIDVRLNSLNNRPENPEITASYLLKLSHRAGDIFKSSKPEEKINF